MTLLATLILGALAVGNLPVSLMPDLDIPTITVQVSYKNASARQLESKVIDPLRRELSSLNHLKDIRSEARNENGILSLEFLVGTNVDLAFIEANEKVDRAMRLFPREVTRPKVIKTTASDLPVFYLNIQNNNSIAEKQSFSALSNYTLSVIRKRLEQLPEVAMVDVSGTVSLELVVVPDLKKLNSLGVSPELLYDLIQKNNVDIGNMTILDGQYQYNVLFSSAIRNKNDIEKLYLRIGDRSLQVSDVATVLEKRQQRKGMITSAGNESISLAIIKQGDAQMSKLKEKLGEVIAQLEQQHPTLSFGVTRDQTKLLDQSISNLEQDLIWGSLLALVIMTLFLKDFKSPMLIALTLPTSLALSFILFYLLDISINIISLSGLVLGIGMMIDNSIIVIDNIDQHQLAGSTLDSACIKGTTEVFAPMFSSVLTTCSVFVPLIFLSGIAGQLFYDQALAVAIGAFVSLLVSITLIPVYYRLLHRRSGRSERKWHNFLNKIDYERFYHRSFFFVMRHQKGAWAMAAIILFLGVGLWFFIPKRILPDLAKDEVVLRLDWNERINVFENERRVSSVMQGMSPLLETYTAAIGEQEYVLQHELATSSEAIIYCKVKSPDRFASFCREMQQKVLSLYPRAILKFEESENVFNLIFVSREAPLTLRMFPKDRIIDPAALISEVELINRTFPHVLPNQIPLENYLVLTVDAEKLMAYDLTLEDVKQRLTTAFQPQHLFSLAGTQTMMPVMFGLNSAGIQRTLNTAEITNGQGKTYRLGNFVTETTRQDLKFITGNKEGEYYGVNFDVEQEQAVQLMEDFDRVRNKESQFTFDFVGSVFSKQKLIYELSLILIISLILLYLIIASQFESLTLPLIVLAEIPIDIAGSLLFLKAFGESINVMSLIGMVVMGGIIINDSILKIDTIVHLRKSGHSLLKAIIYGGQRRLKSILMTSLVTSLAMIPLLFTPGLGAELQKPLALALMGGMIIGTVVSLYFIPLFFFYLQKGPERNVKVAQ